MRRIGYSPCLVVCAARGVCARTRAGAYPVTASLLGISPHAHSKNVLLVGAGPHWAAVGPYLTNCCQYHMNLALTWPNWLMVWPSGFGNIMFEELWRKPGVRDCWCLEDIAVEMSFRVVLEYVVAASSRDHVLTET